MLKIYSINRFQFFFILYINFYMLHIVYIKKPIAIEYEKMQLTYNR
jgi:hypothetical protein